MGVRPPRQDRDVYRLPHATGRTPVGDVQQLPLDRKLVVQPPDVNEMCDVPYTPCESQQQRMFDVPPFRQLGVQSSRLDLVRVVPCATGES